MPVLLALLSLLGGCSSMLDLPDQPQVSMETTAPLQPQPGHGAREGGGAWHEPGPWQGAAGAPPEGDGLRAADAGATAPAEDAGVELRLSAR